MRPSTLSFRPEDWLKFEYILQLYKIAFDRPADAAGLMSFVEQLVSGVPLARLAEEFVQSVEFSKKHPAGPVDTVANVVSLYSKAYGILQGEEIGRRYGRMLGAIPGLGAKISALIELERTPDNVHRSRLPEGMVSNDTVGYRAWLVWNEGRSSQDRENRAAEARRLPWRPLVSLLMFPGMGGANRIDRSIRSVAAQVYEKTELVIVGPSSLRLTAAAVRTADWAGRARFVGHSPWLGMADRLKLALKSAKGDVVGVLGAGDELAAVAVSDILTEFNRSDVAGLVYADEDFIDGDGARSKPWFKTDWDPDAMLAFDQIGRPAFMRTALLRQICSDDIKLNRAWEYDILLRVTDRLAPEQIRRVPSVLYHRLNEAASPRASCPDARRKVVEAHLIRIGCEDCGVKMTDMGGVRIERPHIEPPPFVSIIIPTRDKADLLEACVKGLAERTENADFEIIIVDNKSEDLKTKFILNKLSSFDNIKIIEYPFDFNWGAINNFAVRFSRGEVIVLLNNDIEVFESGWLRELTAQAMRPEIGIVGATLLYPDRTLQHAGIALGPDGASAHIGRHLTADSPGEAGRLTIVRSVTAVTGACMALRRSVYDELGGIEEVNLQVTWSDTDLCLKAWAAGYRVLMTPYARLIHIELATRGSDDEPQAAARFQREREWMRDRWGARLDSDPYVRHVGGLKLTYSAAL